MTDTEVKEMEVNEMRGWGLARLREACQGLQMTKRQLNHLNKSQLMEQLERAIRGAGAVGSSGGSSRSRPVPMSWGPNA